MNERTQNIGARRLHTLVEKLLEDLLFEAPDRRGVTVTVTVPLVVVGRIVPLVAVTTEVPALR